MRALGDIKSLFSLSLVLSFLPSLPSIRWHRFSQCVEITILFFVSGVTGTYPHGEDMFLEGLIAELHSQAELKAK